jgi:oligopeptide transport system substrate-binding protein
VPPARLEHYVKNEPALLRRQPLHETRYLALNTRRGPLADVRVRQALALALDRQALVANVLKGGQQPTADLIPAGLGGLPPNASLPVTADPVAARRLLAEAGFPEGRDFPRLEFSTWTNTPVLEAIQQMWQQNLGITAAITLREGRAHLGALAAGEFDLALMPLIPDYDDPSDAFGEFLSDNPTNYGRWANAGYDREVIEAGRTLEASTRVARYRAAEKILREELPAIPLYLSAQNYLVSSRVQGWQSDRLWTRYYQGITLQDN